MPEDDSGLNRRNVLKSIGIGALGSTLAVAGSGSVSATTDDSTHYHNALYGPHFPDPTIHRAGDGTWWAYGTNMNRNNDSDELLIPILRSDNLHEWTYVGEAFDSRPGWTYGPSGTGHPLLRRRVGDVLLAFTPPVGER
ncbi:hypothetical protein [Haloferax sp. ATB1]|uniref:hypothetical protein n=1 Tax=Haloferax sp. ATB1 TaxID=1508454 RepID=UPI001F51BB55|nr:hypothetical protein [Haloferax sp. ATB1]